MPAASNTSRRLPETTASMPFMQFPFRLQSNSTLTPKESVNRTRETFNKSSAVVATVRGILVIVRMCGGAQVDLNSGTRQEVRIVKALNSENLLKFMGACIERQRACVFGEYCSRGTLQVITVKYRLLRRLIKPRRQSNPSIVVILYWYTAVHCS